MKRFLLAPIALLLLGCGEDFDPQEELQSLRVLTVQKSNPYPRPDEVVDFSMLWHDGRDGGPPFEAAEDIHWFAGCVNPFGGYAACYLDVAIAYLLREMPPALRPDLPHGYGQGETFTWQVPLRTTFGAPVVQPGMDPSQPGYGSSFVFFAACPGELVLDPEVEGPLNDFITQVATQCFDPSLTPEEQQLCVGGLTLSDSPLFDLLQYQGFPLFCRVGEDYLGPKDYVAGYSQMFIYEESSGITNSNPPIGGVTFGGETPEACTCVDAQCLGEPECDVPDAELPTVPACADDGDRSCPEHSFKLDLVPDEVVEVDSALSGGLREQMWINYYVDAGGVSSALRLLNEPERGWNEDHGTGFLAPKDPGRVNLWAVVHDNRGGISWAKQTIVVE